MSDMLTSSKYPHRLTPEKIEAMGNIDFAESNKKQRRLARLMLAKAWCFDNGRIIGSVGTQHRISHYNWITGEWHHGEYFDTKEEAILDAYENRNNNE